MKIKFQYAFTLIEMIVVVSIMGICAAILVPFMSRPFESYQRLAQRAELVSLLDQTMQQIERDVNNAVPNSLRVDGSAKHLELMHASDVLRYRNAAGIDTPDSLFVSAPDNSFNVFGNLSGLKNATVVGRAVVYSSSPQILYNAAVGLDVNGNRTTNPGVITPHSVIATPDGALWEANIQLDARDTAFSFDPDFGTGSPRRLVYFMDTPVLYACSGVDNAGRGTMRRYANYAPRAGMPGVPVSGATSALALEHISYCNFNYDVGTAQRAGLLTINLELTSGQQTVRLIHQVPVLNAP